MTLEAVESFLKHSLENDKIVLMMAGSETPLIITSPKLSHKLNAISGIGADRKIMVDVDNISLLTTFLDGDAGE